MSISVAYIFLGLSIVLLFSKLKVASYGEARCIISAASFSLISSIIISPIILIFFDEHKKASQILFPILSLRMDLCL